MSPRSLEEKNIIYLNGQTIHFHIVLSFLEIKSFNLKYYKITVTDAKVTLKSDIKKIYVFFAIIFPTILFSLEITWSLALLQVY